MREDLHVISKTIKKEATKDLNKASDRQSRPSNMRYAPSMRLDKLWTVCIASSFRTFSRPAGPTTVRTVVGKSELI